jgi:hypothetical protein
LRNVRKRPRKKKGNAAKKTVVRRATGPRGLEGIAGSDGTGVGVIVTDWFCDFQLRVDGAQPPGNGGRAVLYAGGGLQNDATAGDTTFFNGLAAGSHAITISVRGSGTTLACEIDHGDPTDEIFVEEMPA